MQAQKRRLLQQCKDILHGGFVTSAIIENRNLQPIGQAVFQRQCGMGIRFHRRWRVAPGKQQRNEQEKRKQAQKHLVQNGSSQSNMARQSAGKTIIGSSIIAGFSLFFKRRPGQTAADFVGVTTLRPIFPVGKPTKYNLTDKSKGLLFPVIAQHDEEKAELFHGLRVHQVGIPSSIQIFQR